MADKADRVTISLEPDLLAELDRFLEKKGYQNRSQGIRDIVRARFVQEEWEGGSRPTVATVNLVYDHHKRDLMERLAHLQHEHLDAIVTSVHVHLDHEHCLEVLVLRGPGRKLKELGDALIATKGVIHGTMSVSTAGTVADTARRADHSHPHPHGHSHPHAHAHGPSPSHAPAPSRGGKRRRRP